MKSQFFLCFVKKNQVIILSFPLLLECLLPSAAEPDEEVVEGLGGVGHGPADPASELRREGRQEQVGEGVEGLFC